MQARAAVTRDEAVDELLGRPESGGDAEAAGLPVCSEPPLMPAGMPGLSELPGITEAHVKRALRDSTGMLAAYPVNGGFRVPGSTPQDLPGTGSSLTEHMVSLSAESLESLLSGGEKGDDSPMSRQPGMGLPACMHGIGSMPAGAAVAGCWQRERPEEQESLTLAAVLEACVVRRALSQYACTSRACLRYATGDFVNHFERLQQGHAGLILQSTSNSNTSWCAGAWSKRGLGQRCALASATSSWAPGTGATRSSAPCAAAVRARRCCSRTAWTSCCRTPCRCIHVYSAI